MAANLPEMSGGQLVVAALRAHGVDMAFSVAGESYLEVLDALFDAPEIKLVTCRQEGGAAFMAEAYGKLTGKPGVLLVTRGPGAVALPEDMLRDRAAAAVVGPYRAVRAHPGAADLAELRRLLAAAERPIVLVGGSGWTDAACADIARFAEA